MESSIFDLLESTIGDGMWFQEIAFSNAFATPGERRTTTPRRTPITYMGKEILFLSDFEKEPSPAGNHNVDSLLLTSAAASVMLPAVITPSRNIHLSPLDPFLMKGERMDGVSPGLHKDGTPQGFIPKEHVPPIATPLPLKSTSPQASAASPPLAHSTKKDHFKRRRSKRLREERGLSISPPWSPPVPSKKGTKVTMRFRGIRGPWGLMHGSTKQPRWASERHIWLLPSPLRSYRAGRLPSPPPSLPNFSKMKKKRRMRGLGPKKRFVPTFQGLNARICFVDKPTPWFHIGGYSSDDCDFYPEP